VLHFRARSLNDEDLCWVWGFTLKTALEMNPGFTFRARHELFHRFDCHLFRTIGRMYDERLIAKAAGKTALETAIKLSMNSVYGKTGARLYDRTVHLGMNP